MSDAVPRPPASLQEAAQRHGLGRRIIWDQSRPKVPSRMEIYLAVVSTLLLIPAVVMMLTAQKWYEASLVLAVPALTSAWLVAMWLYHALRPVEWCAVHDEGLVYQRSGADPLVVTWADVSAVCHRRQFLSLMGSADGPGLGSSAVVELRGGGVVKLRRRFTDAESLAQMAKAASDLAAARERWR